MNKHINELVKEAFEISKQHGFHDTDSDIEKGSEQFHLIAAQRLALLHSEISEALEADRKNRFADLKSFENADNSTDEKFNHNFKQYIKDTFEDELADTMIRIFDICGWLNIDIERHIDLKMKYNSLREHKNGKQY